MGGKINVAIVGLGRVGSTFLRQLFEHQGGGFSIVAVKELNPDAPGVAFAKKNNIPLYEDDDEIIAMGDKLDIIFNLTGTQKARRELRMSMVRCGNNHTVIVAEIVAFMMWHLIAEGKELPDAHAFKGY